MTALTADMEIHLCLLFSPARLPDEYKRSARLCIVKWNVNNTLCSLIILQHEKELQKRDFKRGFIYTLQFSLFL